MFPPSVNTVLFSSFWSCCVMSMSVPLHDTLMKRAARQNHNNVTEPNYSHLSYQDPTNQGPSSLNCQSAALENYTVRQECKQQEHSIYIYIYIIKPTSTFKSLFDSNPGLRSRIFVWTLGVVKHILYCLFYCIYVVLLSLMILSLLSLLLLHYLMLVIITIRYVIITNITNYNYCYVTIITVLLVCL